MRHFRLINELSEYDIWSLKMAVMISNDKRIQCSECLIKYTSEITRERMGCTSLQVPRKLDGFIYSKCLGNFYNAGYSSVVDLYYKYKSGTLGDEGGMFNQSAKYLQAMNYVGSLITKIELDRIEAIKKKSKNKV